MKYAAASAMHLGTRASRCVTDFYACRTATAPCFSVTSASPAKMNATDAQIQKLCASAKNISNRSSKPWNRPPGGQAGARSKAVHQGRDRCGGGGVRAARLGGSERRGWSTVADLRVGASLDGMLVALLAATGVPLRGLRLGECGLAAQR